MSAPPDSHALFRPLDGAVVAGFGRVLAGPLSTMTLADLGAAVVKVEHPSGEGVRRLGPPWTERGAAHLESVDRTKQSVRRDLSDSGDLAAAHELVRRADLLVENFRTRSLKMYGLDQESTRAANPRLIHHRIRQHRRLSPSRASCPRCGTASGRDEDSTSRSTCSAACWARWRTRRAPTSPRVSRRAAWAIGIPRSPHTRRCGAPTASSRSPAATPGSSLVCAACWGSPSWLRTPGAPRTATASPIAPRSWHCWRNDSPNDPPPTGRSSSRRSTPRPARSTRSRRRRTGRVPGAGSPRRDRGNLAADLPPCRYSGFSPRPRHGTLDDEVRRWLSHPTTDQENS